MAFHVGQKVVCVEDGPGWKQETGSPITTEFPRKGAIYVVAATDFWGGNHFVEVDRIPRMFFDACVFRPIVEKKTDISIFTSMLTPAPKEKVGV